MGEKKLVHLADFNTAVETADENAAPKKDKNSHIHLEKRKAGNTDRRDHARPHLTRDDMVLMGINQDRREADEPRRQWDKDALKQQQENQTWVVAMVAMAATLVILVLKTLM